MTTHKRQLSFYAEADVDLYLELNGSGNKTRILNDTIRSRMMSEASVDMNDGKKPVHFADLGDADQGEVYANLVWKELSADDVDDQVWQIVRETISPNWKENTKRYLALHEAKFREPFRIKRMRTQAERDKAPKADLKDFFNRRRRK